MRTTDTVEKPLDRGRYWEEIAGVRDPNSGGNVVFLSPGLRLSYDKWSSFVSVGVPIVTNLNGLQAEPDWRILTGVAINF